jgi:hypothetical protein
MIGFISSQVTHALLITLHCSTQSSHHTWCLCRATNFSLPRICQDFTKNYSRTGFIWNLLQNITRVVLHSFHADRTETSASNVGTRLSNNCIATVTALTAQNTSHLIPSQRIHLCAACCWTHTHIVVCVLTCLLTCCLAMLSPSMLQYII